MKTAWVYTRDYNYQLEGKITRITTDSEWDIVFVKNGVVLGVPFDETSIDENFAKARKVDNVWEIYEDTAEKEAAVAREVEESNISWELLCMEYTSKSRAYLNYLFRQANYGQEEWELFLGDIDFQLINTLFTNGAIDVPLAIISNKEVNSYFTQPIKSALIAKLTEYSAIVGNPPA